MKKLCQLVKTYSKDLIWLVLDLFKQYSASIPIVLFAGFVGVTLLAATFFLFLFLIQKLAAGKSIDLPFGQGELILDHMSVVEMALIGFGVFLLLFLSETAVYYSRKKTLNLSKLYAEFCSKRILEYISSPILTLGLYPKNIDLNKQALLRAGTKDSRICGIALRKILDSIVPVIVIMVSLGGMIYLNTLLSIIIAGILLIYVFFQARVSRQGARYSAKSEKNSPIARKEYSNLLDSFLSDNSKGWSAESTISESFRKGAIAESNLAYINRLVVIPHSRYVTGFFSAVIISILFIDIFSSINEQTDWSEIFIFLIALRFALVNLKQVFVNLTAINRTYAGIRKYIGLVEFLKSDSVSEFDPFVVCQFDHHNRSLPKSLTQVKIEKGSVYSIFSDLDNNRFGIIEFYKIISGNLDRALSMDFRKIRFISDNDIPQFATIDSLLWEYENFALLNDANGKLTNLVSSSLSIDKGLRLTPQLWNSIGKSERYILNLISAMISESDLIILDADDFYEELLTLEPILASQTNKAVFIIHHSNDNIVGKLKESLVFIISQHTLLGVGDSEWYGTVYDRIHINYSKVNEQKTLDDGLDIEDE